jgi:hypothetical protein
MVPNVYAPRRAVVCVRIYRESDFEQWRLTGYVYLWDHVGAALCKAVRERMPLAGGGGDHTTFVEDRVSSAPGE